MRLESANLGMAAAYEKAKELELRGIAVAIVDPAGVMVAFQRSTGVPALPATVAEAKAATSAFANAPTERLAMVEERWPLLTEPMQARLGQRFTRYGGGMPITVNTHLIGAIGVSGGTPEQDAIIAQHAANAIAEAEAV